MVILDELCSGTNPSEGVEMFALVLKLLGQVEPLAFVGASARAGVDPRELNRGDCGCGISSHAAHAEREGNR